MRQETSCVHSGTRPDRATGGVNTPIYTSTAFTYLDTEKQPYPRYFNTPNQRVVAAKLSALEQAAAGVVFSSGMAAISTAMLAVAGHGDHVVLQEEIYGGTHAFITRQFDRLGIGYTFVDKSAAAIERAVRPDTRLIFIETPTNPLLGIVDIGQVAALARERRIITMIDNTFASPVLQNPLPLGIDIVVHSGTKYLGGHSDICCGVVLAGESLVERIKMTAADFGGSLDARACSLLERSLKTLHLRVTRQAENALAIARLLTDNELIETVYYPGLESHPGHRIAARQMSGFGGMLSFTLGERARSPSEFLRGLRLIVPAMSLGGVETTICAPAATSHSKMTREARERLGIGDRLLRLSVGIEHPDDLAEDISQALGG